MAKFTKKNGSTSNILRVFLQDSTKTDGSGLTGLTSASAGLKIVTIADVEASVTAYTQAGGTIEGITTYGTYETPTATKCRFEEIDATNLPGWYEIHLADARFAVSSAKALQVMILGAANLAPCNVEIQLTAADLDDGTDLGLSTLDAAISTRASQTSLDTVDDLLDTEVAAIKAKTDNLPSDPADASDVASAFSTVNTKLDTIDDFLDTEIAAIKAKTDNLPASPAAVGSAMTLATDAVSSAALAADTGLKPVRSGTAQAGGALSITLDASASAVNDFYARQVIYLVGGTGAGQTNVIASYVGATKAATVEHAWATNPDNTSVFVILPEHVQVSADFDDAILDGVIEGTTTLRESARLWNSAMGGIASGLATTSAIFRDLDDSKDRITATVDADGNRSAVTLDLS